MNDSEYLYADSAKIAKAYGMTPEQRLERWRLLTGLRPLTPRRRFKLRSSRPAKDDDPAGHGPPLHSFGGRHDPSYRNELSPWLENAIRALEDCYQ